MLLPHHQRGPPRQLGEACGEVTPFFFSQDFKHHFEMVFGNSCFFSLDGYAG